MKIEAKIEWVIDDKQLNIKSGSTEIVDVDTDYVEADEASVIEWIENELEEKYGTWLQASRDPSDDGDFVIKNLQDIIDDLKFDEFEEKTEYTRV